MCKILIILAVIMYGQCWDQSLFASIISSSNITFSTSPILSLCLWFLWCQIIAGRVAPIFTDFQRSAAASFPHLVLSIWSYQSLSRISLASPCLNWYLSYRRLIWVPQLWQACLLSLCFIRAATLYAWFPQLRLLLCPEFGGWLFGGHVLFYECLLDQELHHYHLLRLSLAGQIQIPPAVYYPNCQRKRLIRDPDLNNRCPL